MSFEDKRSLTCRRIVDSPEFKWRDYLRQFGQRCADKWLNDLADYIRGPNDQDSNHQPDFMYGSQDVFSDHVFFSKERLF
jgi:hypothetical protein